MKIPRARRTTKLPETLLHQLNGYALAASAAGVGVIAAANPCQAKVVYTPAHITISPGSGYYFDLNHDGIYDFRIQNYSSCDSTACWPLSGNISALSATAGARHDFNLRSQGVEGNICCSLYALPRGAKIGASKSFLYDAGFSRNWKKSQTAYVGLQFQIKKKTHYGWARIRVDRSIHSIYLLGFAYETVVNKAIIAGKTHGADVVEYSPSASVVTERQGALGLLARGSTAIGAWRRPN